MRPLLKQIFGVLSSFGLTCVILILLGLLTWLGTLEQVERGLYDVQKEYFESFFLIYRVGFLGIPLPGANLLMCALFVNIICGGMVRLRKSWSRVGIFIAHVGIALLLLSGFVKLYFSDYGQMSLYAGERANVFSDYHLWEIAISRQLGDGQIQEFLIPQEDLVDARGPRPVVFTSPELPFDLELSNFMPNSSPQARDSRLVRVPLVEDIFLRQHPVAPQQEGNVAGIYATAVEKGTGVLHQGILWGRRADFDPSTARASTPWTVVMDDGELWGIELRNRQYILPFGIELELFRKEDHPRMNSPKWFSSDVLVLEDQGERPVEISMNQPLRTGGYVVYQASWGPGNAVEGDPLYSSLAVSRNPSDKYPLMACIIIALGLIGHLSRKLIKYIRSEAKVT